MGGTLAVAERGITPLGQWGRAGVLAGGEPFRVEIITSARTAPPHQHDFLELAIVLEGTGFHVSQEGPVRVSRGNAVVVRTCDWHGWEDTDHLILANVYVDQLALRSDVALLSANPLLRSLAWPVPTPLERVTGLAHLAPEALRQVENAVTALNCPAPGAPPVSYGRHSVGGANGGRGRAVTDLTTAAGTTALGHLLVILGSVTEAVRPGRTGRCHPAVRSAILQLDADLARPWTAQLLGQAVGASAGHLTRLFHQTCGAPPIAVLAGLRGERAASYLVATEWPVAVIGARVGWPDPNYFARRFRALYGISPRQYRARFR